MELKIEASVGSEEINVERDASTRYEKKARNARSEMELYDGEMSRAEINFRSTNTAISQVGVVFLYTLYC